MNSGGHSSCDSNNPNGPAKSELTHARVTDAGTPWTSPPGPSPFARKRGMSPLLRDQHVAERGGIHGFDQVHVEAGLAGTLAVDFLAPAGECHQHGIAAPALGADATRDLAAVQLGHADVE